MDRLVDEVREDPFYPAQPAIADMIVDAIRYNADVLGHSDRRDAKSRSLAGDPAVPQIDAIFIMHYRQAGQ
jgi:hypothetical protein